MLPPRPARAAQSANPFPAWDKALQLVTTRPARRTAPQTLCTVGQRDSTSSNRRLCCACTTGLCDIRQLLSSSPTMAAPTAAVAASAGPVSVAAAAGRAFMQGRCWWGGGHLLPASDGASDRRARVEDGPILSVGWYARGSSSDSRRTQGRGAACIRASAACPLECSHKPPT